MVDDLRRLARRVLPFAVRLEAMRLARWPSWLLETPTLARHHASDDERAQHQQLLAVHASPLERQPGAVEARLQRGKERNVALIARLLDGLVVAPNQIFSYHRTVGRPARWRGFRSGMELRDGRPSSGVGGGACQVSNLLYLVALRGGMKIVERHRHALDLFPDHERTVPFGCGATVFFPYADLRFENPLPQPVLLRLFLDGKQLRGELRAAGETGFSVEIYETDHRIWREGDACWRENRIRRRFLRTDDSTLLLDEEVAHNRGRVLYPVD